MAEVIIFSICVISPILASAVFFVVCLTRFISGKLKNKAKPDSVSAASMKARTVWLIVSVIVGVIVIAAVSAIIGGIIIMLASAITYM